MNGTRQPILATLFRLALYILFWILLWKTFGWGWSVSAFLLISATGLYHGKAIVPIPGLLRMVLELSFIVMSCVAATKVLGSFWSIVIIVLTIVIYLMNVGYLKNILRHRHA